MADREVRRFYAVDDDKKRYEIIERIDVLTVHSFQSSPEELEGQKSYKLVGGGMLNKITDTEFEIVETGKRVQVKR